VSGDANAQSSVRAEIDEARGRVDGDNASSGVSSHFLYVNTNKESLTLDYETQAGATVFHRLIEDADGLIEDVPSRRQAALGLDSAALLANEPRLVICRVSAFAPHGPRAGEPYDVLGGVSAEYSTGFHAFTAMLAALWHASQSEHGQVIEVDGLSSLASELGPALTQAFNGAAVEASRPAVPPDVTSLDLDIVEHPTAGAVSTPAGPFELEETPWLAGRAPLPGEHTDQVLGDIDLEAAEIEALRREGVV
jgi:crotonobetainyl-CoA:carnitine CoA-transferase CaiB-like acyl-CoA transferase